MKTPIQSLRLYLEEDLIIAKRNKKEDKIRYIQELIEIINLKFINQEKMSFVQSYESGMVDPIYRHGLEYYYKVYDEKLTLVL